MSRMKELAMERAAENPGDLFAYPHRPGFKTGGTSRAAADSMVSSSTQIQALVLECLATSPKTVHETATALEMEVATVQPRFSELLKLGKIEATGERRKNKSGRSADVWRRK